MEALLLANVALAAEALITWTPVTYYVTAAIVHAIIIFAGFRILQVDPEHNSVVGAVIGAAIIAAACFVLKGGELFSALGGIGIIFLVLLGVSGGEAIKAVLVSVAVIGSYGLTGGFLIPRTPLDLEDIGGLTQVVMTGEFKVVPIEGQEDDLYEHTKEKTDRDLEEEEWEDE
jgi:hypothetical protein